MKMDSERRLTSVEAAYELGITQELLFAYVRNSPKSGQGQERRLNTVQHEGQTYFYLSELRSFDGFLKEPWSVDASVRAPVPSYVIDYLKVECDAQCARCGRGFKLETAHIVDYAKSLSHHHHNLIRLCSLCHEEFDTKKILPTDEIASLKSRLIARTRERLANKSEGMPRIGLPPSSITEIFIGRDREVSNILEGLTTRRVVCIKGVGGIGKTQLALHAIAKLDKKTRVFWIDLEPYETIAELEQFLISAFSRTGVRTGPNLISEKFELENDLVVFDGVETFAATQILDFEDFLTNIIAKTRSPKFLITSQIELLSIDGIFNIDILSLPSGASLQILRAVVGESVYVPVAMNEDAAFEWLVNYSDGHPLTLRIIAGLLRYFKSAQVVVNRVKTFGVSALVTPVRRSQNKSSSLEVCFSAAYSLLQSSERRLLFLLAHCPAGCSATLFENAGSFDIQDYQNSIAELARWHFIEVDVSAWPFPRLRSTSPIRSFVRTSFENEDALTARRLFYELATLLEILAKVMDDCYTGEGDASHGTRRLIQEFPNFSYVFDKSLRLASVDPSYWRIVCSLTFSLQVFCFVTGRSKRGLQILSAGAIAAQKLGHSGIASSFLLQLINFARRERLSEQVKSAIQELCALPNLNNDVEQEGNVAYALGLLAMENRNLDDAEIQFRTACEKYLSLQCEGRPEASDIKKPNDRHRMSALALMELGGIYEHSGRAAEALEFYSNSLSQIIQLRDRVNEGAVLHQMGNCHADLGDYAKAYDAYLGAAQSFNELGSAIHLSNSLGELGYVLIDYDPGLRIRNDLPEVLLEAGLMDLFQECSKLYRPTQYPLNSRMCIGVIRKLFGMASLISFTSHTRLLDRFALALREQLVLPLAERIAIERTDNPEEHLAIMHLDVMTALIGSLGLVQSNEESVTIMEVGHFASLCYQQLKWAWRAFRLFEWLVEYLDRRRGFPGLSVPQLQEAAKRAAISGGPFSL